MRLLIDTHVLIWWTGERNRLPQRVRVVLADASNEVFVSAVSAWEIAQKIHQRKLMFDKAFLADFDKGVAGLAFKSLVMTSAQATVGAQLPSPHKDPFDRMLAGQALVEQMAIVSADPAFARLGVQVVW